MPQTPGKPRKRIAVAIDLDDPWPEQHGSYRGILSYAKQQKDWLCVVDPYVAGEDAGHGARYYAGIVGRIYAGMAADARQAGVPMANLWATSPVKGLAGVRHDYTAAGQLAGEHLIERGYREFGYLGISRNRYAAHEIAGFDGAIEAAGFKASQKLRLPRRFEVPVSSFVRFRKELNHWLNTLTRPVGVFVSFGSVMARYLAQSCQESGIHVPHELGIVTLGDHLDVALGAEPTLSAVVLDHERLGYRAAQMLDALMQNPVQGSAFSADNQLIAPRGLTIRQSSDAFLVDDPQVAEALKYIFEHADQPLAIDEVAQAVHTTSRTLARRFEAVLGQTIYSEIQRLRVEYIKRRLAESDRSMGTIADECGFTSPSHFSLFFRKVAGVTPRAYRQRHTTAVE